MKISVESLVGKDIAGLKAITNNPIYLYQYPVGFPVRTLKEAKYKTEGGFKWLYIYWEKDGSMSDCGFSGWREDHFEQPMIELL
jgi:hypothetical protein